MTALAKKTGSAGLFCCHRRGGLLCLPSAYPAAVVSAGGACPLCRLPTLPLWCPQGGLPGRHWLDLPRGRGPSQTPKFLSPGPPSPWLPALPPVNKQKPLVVQVPRPAQPWGCKGRSPLHKKTKSLPLPLWGRGLGGYPSPSGKGGKNKAKGRVDRQQRRQAPRRAPGAAWSSDDYPGKPPCWAPGAAPQPQQKKQSPEPRTNLPPQQLYSRKVLGGLGASFKKPPTYP